MNDSGTVVVIPVNQKLPVRFVKVSDASDWKALSVIMAVKDLCVQAQDNPEFTILAAENQSGLAYNSRASILAKDSPLQGDVCVLSATASTLTRRNVFHIKTALRASLFVSETEQLRATRKYKTATLKRRSSSAAM